MGRCPKDKKEKRVIKYKERSLYKEKTQYYVYDDSTRNVPLVFDYTVSFVMLG